MSEPAEPATSALVTALPVGVEAVEIIACVGICRVVEDGPPARDAVQGVVHEVAADQRADRRRRCPAGRQSTLDDQGVLAKGVDVVNRHAQRRSTHFRQSTHRPQVKDYRESGRPLLHKRLSFGEMKKRAEAEGRRDKDRLNEEVKSLNLG